MQIILTRNLKGPKAVAHGFIEGAAFDWPRSVITSVSKQEGSESWYRFSAELERRRVASEASEVIEASDADEGKRKGKRRVHETEELEV
ncbi:MAG: hypothetical protein KKG25_16360 [Bacteroidetes bacterium]|nr:hypothetical protein [Bacteroidota bacterium]MBU1486422.1 hypothetical protein [Bacteroidota bacterium]